MRHLFVCSVINHCAYFPGPNSFLVELLKFTNKKNEIQKFFSLPTDDLLASAKVIRVNLFLEKPDGQTEQVGVRLLKTEKNETLIENLSLSNCISALKQSLGLSSMLELDGELARRFKRTVPVENLNKLLVEHEQTERRPVIEDLLTGDPADDQLPDTRQPLSQPISQPIGQSISQSISQSTSQRNSLTSSSQSDGRASELDKTCKVNNKVNKTNSPPKSRPCGDRFTEHEYPTLLHFAAEFDLKQFATSLLEFEPIAIVCGTLKNCHGLTAHSLAKLNGHNEISQLIKRYTKADQDDQIIDLSETEPDSATDDLDYVNMSIVRLPDKEPTSDFITDSSDQSSIDGVDSVDGLILKRNNKPTKAMNDYDFINQSKPIRLGKLIDLDSLSTGEETSGDDLRPPPKSNRSCAAILKDELREGNFDYDIVKASPRRADLGDSPLNPVKSLSGSFSNREKCKANLFERFDGLRVSSSSSTPSQESEPKSIDLQTSNLTESQIELLNIIKAFKMGCYTNDEMEVKFKQWAAKHKCKIDQNNRFETEANRMGKRSVSSSHLLSQDAKLESKDSCSSRSSTIKTCLSNINLHAAAGSPSKYGKQFSLTDWFHTLTAKLKQKPDRNDGARKSPKFENAKFEKKVGDFEL